jgi:hypothetical protein
MHVNKFLASLLDKDISALPVALSFTDDPRIFLRFVSEYLRSVFHDSVATIDLCQLDFVSIHSQLHMTFLGRSKWFMLVHYKQCDAKKQKKIDELLQDYTGPHRLLLGDAPEKHTVELITVDRVDRTLIQQLNAIIFKDQAKPVHIPSFLDSYTHLGLDQLCLSLSYIHVLGKKSDLFFDTWGEQIVATEQSLFALSGYFFARQKNQFFTIWSKVYSRYSDAFWMSFWSEQLWQAMSYIDASSYTRNSKKLFNRLAFSFKQRHWRSYKMQELVAAHQYLYFLDHAMKHGHPDWGIELFLFMFLDEQFALPVL